MWGPSGDAQFGERKRRIEHRLGPGSMKLFRRIEQNLYKTKEVNTFRVLPGEWLLFVVVLARFPPAAAAASSSSPISPLAASNLAKLACHRCTNAYSEPR